MLRLGPETEQYMLANITIVISMYNNIIIVIIIIIGLLLLIVFKDLSFSLSFFSVHFNSVTFLNFDTIKA